MLYDKWLDACSNGIFAVKLGMFGGGACNDAIET